jgi:hypothetical protein
MQIREFPLYAVFIFLGVVPLAANSNAGNNLLSSSIRCNKVEI